MAFEECCVGRIRRSFFSQVTCEGVLSDFSHLKLKMFGNNIYFCRRNIEHEIFYYHPICHSWNRAAGIPIDIITGTSMGSIVGGLYACGNDAMRLDSIVRSQDWTVVLSDRDNLKYQSLKERELHNTYTLSTSLRLKKNKTSIGGGFIIGKNISKLLRTFTYPYNDPIDFNTLPIQFACVATDVVDNSEIVIHSGVLSEAMRASMSIPGAFSPVRKDGRVHVDGGLRNNYPTI